AYSFRVTGFDPARNVVLYAASDCPAAASPATVTGCLGAANRNASAGEEVKCLSLTAGQTVYLYVDEASLGTGSSFVLEANRCVQETEINDTPAQAEEPSCGIEGAITPANEADMFKLGTPASGSRVFAMVDGAASGTNDYDLRVTTATDTLEYDDNN